eukprot:TRINITY_DN1087_c2_g1_i2.p1 TRINITY_DN1087_c2_g1~~TRINITY_DN1087_c2_g1_i2.p1  ORF type:complete len:113 (+),score=26.16 TRINITY_DN1087_c2_g1_i2:666-1004(+)
MPLPPLPPPLPLPPPPPPPLLPPPEARSAGELAASCDGGPDAGAFACVAPRLVGAHLADLALAADDRLAVRLALLDARVTVELGLVRRETPVLDDLVGRCALAASFARTLAL